MTRSKFQQGYRFPPQEIVDIVDTPSPPEVSLSPNGEWLLFTESPPLWPLSYLAQPELRLAGIRFHTATHSLSRQRYSSRLWLKRIADQREQSIRGIPEGSLIHYILWSPDSRYLAFSLTDSRSMTLWVAEVDTGKVHCLTDRPLNDTLGTPVGWLPDSQHLLCKLAPAGWGTPPESAAIPDGPLVQESHGEIIPPRNHPDRLNSAHDEALFAYYTASQIARVSLSGEVQLIGPPALRAKVLASPDGDYLFVETVYRPFSHLVPFYRFPMRLEVWDSKGNVVREVADLPLADQIPMAFGAVRGGPRHVTWRADAPATLSWVEARDGGDPRQEADVRDEIVLLAAPFTQPPRRLLSLSWRFREILWGNEHLALVTEHWKKTHAQRTWFIDPSHPETGPHLLWENGDVKGSGSKRRGTPVLRWNTQGRVVLHTPGNGRGIFCVGNGAVPGSRGTSLYRLDPVTGETESVWSGGEGCPEIPHEILDEKATRLLTWQHPPGEPSNLFLRDREKDERIPLTHFVHLTPPLRDVPVRTLRYWRADGKELSAALHLPPDTLRRTDRCR